ncbi:hypothetical protein NL676_021189 [Syzygium grande]|nr:hypothetical protein NL676_021189 [Syzygium grande]
MSPLHPSETLLLLSHSLPRLFLSLLHLLFVFFPSSFRRKADGLSPRGHRLRSSPCLPTPHNCRLRLLASLRLLVVSLALWRGLAHFRLRPPHHLCLRGVGSACCRRLCLVAVACALWSSTLSRGRGLRLSLSPLPRRLHHAAVYSASQPSAPLNSFCLVAIGLVVWALLVAVGFTSWPPPHFASSPSAPPRGVGSASWPLALPHRLHLVAWDPLVAVGSASAS